MTVFAYGGGPVPERAEGKILVGLMGEVPEETGQDGDGTGAVGIDGGGSGGRRVQGGVDGSK